jgi:hypothetical protein
MKRGNVPKGDRVSYMRSMTARALTPEECRLVEEVFGSSFDTEPVRIHRVRWWRFQPRNVLMAPDGHLWCHPDGPLYRECYASAPIGMQALFVHEMTHVWQAQRGGRWYLPLMRHPFCRYVYTLKPGKPFARYGIEQQAEIVADAFLLSRGVPRPGKPALEAYRAMLPSDFLPTEPPLHHPADGPPPRSGEELFGARHPSSSPERGGGPAEPVEGKPRPSGGEW